MSQLINILTVFAIVLFIASCATSRVRVSKNRQASVSILSDKLFCMSGIFCFAAISLYLILFLF